MQSNLDSLFKTSKEVETEGFWLVITDTIGFRLKRFGGFNSPEIKAAMTKYYKPYARLIESGNLSPEKEREVTVKTFVEASVCDWRGVEIEGKEAPFSKEECVKLLIRLPELCDTLMRGAQDVSNFKEVVGNS